MSRTYEYFRENGLLEPNKWDDEYNREYELWKQQTQEQLNNRHEYK